MACHSSLVPAAVTEEVHDMSAGGGRWLVTCSCGWARECVSGWAAQSVSRLHQQLGELGVEHVTSIEGPDGPAGEQLPLV